MSGPIEKARLAFNKYCAMDAPQLPESESSQLQVELARWQTKNFGGGNTLELLAGVAEEAGELAHAVLKNTQKIRGMEDPEKYREAAGDAIADMMIYAIQICTKLRLDWYTLLSATAYDEVMKRNWTKDPSAGGTE